LWGLSRRWTSILHQCFNVLHNGFQLSVYCESVVFVFVEPFVYLGVFFATCFSFCVSLIVGLCPWVFCYDACGERFLSCRCDLRSAAWRFTHRCGGFLANRLRFFCSGWASKACKGASEGTSEGTSEPLLPIPECVEDAVVPLLPLAWPFSLDHGINCTILAVVFMVGRMGRSLPL
jgi:hypothetical protein